MSLKTESEFETMLRKECENRPGPGNYDPFRTSLTNISYSICGKNSKEEIHTKNLTKKMRQSIDAVNKKPGPGEYTILQHSFDSSDSLSTSRGFL